MSTEHFTNSQTTEQERNLWGAVALGARSLCPSCGETKLFSGGLTVQDQCSSCKEELHHHRADDLPAYLNIFVVGHVVVAIMMIVFMWDIMNMWTLMALSCVAAIVAAGLAMRPLKGMVVGAQWALRMHGFGGHDD